MENHLRFSFLQIRIFFLSVTVKIMAVNHVTRKQALSGVLKNVCSESFRIFFPAFTAEGLNDPYGSKAMKEQLTERIPRDDCSNDYFLQVYFYHF